MHLAIVSPRYGASIVGGAERLLRLFAEKLHAEGHRITVLTTCAVDHFTWANALPPGPASIGGVEVRRFPVTIAPNPSRVAQLHHAIGTFDDDADVVPLNDEQQEDLLRNTGFSQGLFDEVDRLGKTVDAFLFAPALLPTTVFGARIHPQRSLVMPCLHDEPYARFTAVQETLRGAAGLLSLSTAEQELTRSLLGDGVRTRLVGAGVELAFAPSAARFTDVPGDFIAYAGRYESGKNYPLLVEWVTAYNTAITNDDGALRLATMGSGGHRLPPSARPWVHDLGFVSESLKHDAMAAAVAVCNLSRWESFSFVVMEAWLSGTPVIVHADCAVTRGHCEESGGGVWVRSAEEFAEAVARLHGDPALRTALATAGQAYVRDRFSWDAVLRRFERAVSELVPGRVTA